MTKPTIILRASVFSRSGYGAHSRDIALALWHSKKYNLSIVPTQWGTSSATDNLSADDLAILRFCCDNTVRQGVEFIFMHVGLPIEFQKIGKINIGVTAGVETSEAPKEWLKPCNLMDAIIVPTEFTRKQLLALGVTAPIYCVGEGPDTDIYPPRKDDDPIPEEIGSFSTPFNFLAMGQWIGGDPFRDRKSIGLLIDWFSRAFEGREDVGLVLKTYVNNISSPDFTIVQERVRLIREGRVLPKIHLLHGDMTEHEVSLLLRHPQIKALVSTTCGEGYGRSTAAAAAVDLPILITGWSAHTHYLYPDLYTALKYTLVDIPPSAYQPQLLYPPMKWALPDREDTIHKMRRCESSYAVAVEWARKQGELFRQSHTRAHTDTELIRVMDMLTSEHPSGILLPDVKGISV